MAAIWTWVRAELRRDLRSSVAVVLIIGLGLGVAMAAVAGARRTDTAYDRFLDTSRAATHRLQYADGEDDPAVDDLVLERLRAHPGVEVAVPIHLLIAFAEETEYDLGILTSADPDFGQAVDRLRLVEGRLPATDGVDEVAVSRFLSEEADLSVGDTLTLGTFSAEQIDQEDFGSEPAGPVLDVTVVGIAVTPDDLADEESGFLYSSAAFAEAYVGVVGGYGPSIELRLHDGADIDEVVTSTFEGIDLVEAPIVEGVEVRADRVRDTTGALSTALLLFAACASVAAAVAAGQALARRLATAAVDEPILEAIGVTRSRRAGALASLAVPLVAVGALVALAVAIAASATMPPGLAGRAEPDPGVDVDVAVLALGTTAAVLLLLGLTGLAGLRLAGTRATGDRGQTVSATVGLAKRAGWSAPAVAGITMALEPGRGRTAVPVRPALIGAIAGTSGVVAALTFGASLDHLTSTPAAYGWNWDLSPDLFDGDAQLLARQDAVEDVGQLFLQEVVVDGRQVQGMAVSSLKGDPSLTMVDGRMPSSVGEVALGPVTADRAGAAIGDRVVVEGPDGEIEVTVVGRALFPVFDDNPFNDAVAFHPDLLGDIAVSEGFGASIVSFRPDVSREEGTALITGLLPEAMTIYAFPTRPPDVENLTQVRGMPRALAAFLVLLAVAAVGHALVTAVRRRRRDLGVLRAVGFRRRQVATTVAVQSLTLVLVGLVLGIPLGVIVGRVAWSLVADGIGVASTITVPGLALGVLVPAALVLGVVLAVLPARAASRLTPADALRTE